MKNTLLIVALSIIAALLLINYGRDFPGTQDIKYTREEMMEKRANQAEVER